VGHPSRHGQARDKLQQIGPHHRQEIPHKSNHVATPLGISGEDISAGIGQGSESVPHTKKKGAAEQQKKRRIHASGATKRNAVTK